MNVFVRCVVKVFCAFVSVSALLTAAESYAASVEWKGGDAANPSDWDTAANWVGGVPSSGDTVIIPAGVATMPTLSSSTPSHFFKKSRKEV